jgi:hypothetical protein
VQHRDAREEEAVGNGGKGVVQVRVRERAERDDQKMRDPRDRAPERRLSSGGYFVGVDGFF